MERQTMVSLTAIFLATLLWRSSAFQIPTTFTQHQTKSKPITTHHCEQLPSPSTKLSFPTQKITHNLHTPSSSSISFAPEDLDDSFFEEEDEDEENTQLIREQKASLASRYRITTILNALTTILILTSPFPRNQELNGARIGGAFGYGLVSILSEMLRDAAGKDEDDFFDERGGLDENVFKRLNVGILGFGLVGLVGAVPGEAWFYPASKPSSKIVLVVMFLTRVVTLLTCWQGWTRGVFGWGKEAVADNAPPPAPTDDGSVEKKEEKKKSIFGEFIGGVKETYKGLEIINIDSSDYRSLLVTMLVVGTVSNVINFKTAVSRFQMSLVLSAIGRLFLLSSLVYSLKDAAERIQLTDTTSIRLHFLVGIWAFAVGFAVPETQNPFGHSATLLAYSFPFFLKGLLSIWEKFREGRGGGDATVTA